MISSLTQDFYCSLHDDIINIQVFFFNLCFRSSGWNRDTTHRRLVAFGRTSLEFLLCKIRLDGLGDSLLQGLHIQCFLGFTGTGFLDAEGDVEESFLSPIIFTPCLFLETFDVVEDMMTKGNTRERGNKDFKVGSS